MSEHCSVAVATGVFRAKEHIVPNEQTVQSADSCVVSYVRTRRHTFCLTEKKTRKMARVRSYLRMWLLKLSEHRCLLLRALKPSDAQKALSHTWWSALSMWEDTLAGSRRAPPVVNITTITALHLKVLFTVLTQTQMVFLNERGLVLAPGGRENISYFL